MKSTSCKDIAREVLERCLAGNPPRDLPRALMSKACGHGLFGVLAEGLGDRFEPALCDAYARLFAQAVAAVHTKFEPGSLVARYERVRRPRAINGKPQKIFVLSRVTLGADVAITSVLMAAAKRRFPHATIYFVGPRKNHELFAADPHIHLAVIEYRRGGLHDRLSVWKELDALVSQPDSVVIDPDSRLTQLGLLPLGFEDRYHLFESRSYGHETGGNLAALASAWAAETFGVKGAKPYLATGPAPRNRAPYIAVSFGVGDNPAKRLPDPFEEEMLKLLASTGMALCVDTGAGGEESERVRAAVDRSGVDAALWQGSFAGFAGIIAAGKMYAGYDSAGQHVAAACGVPMISVFAGFPAPRMFERWRPSGDHCTVIRVDEPDPHQVLGRVREALDARTVATAAE